MATCMRRIARENALCALLALAGCARVGMARPVRLRLERLRKRGAAGLRRARCTGSSTSSCASRPAYGGSLVERAPFALLPGLWGGGALAVYRIGRAAVPARRGRCSACGSSRACAPRTRPRCARAVALAVCVANPITLRALEVGHPEELLGACLCVAAVLLAGDATRRCWAGVALGLAIANKEWALLAAGPVLLALPARGAVPLSGAARRGRRRRDPRAAAARRLGRLRQPPRVRCAAPPRTIFQPWQVWWFLGHHGALVHGAVRRGSSPATAPARLGGASATR